MQATLPKGTLCCIGKCNSGLKFEEWDQITDHVSKTLEHSSGKETFKRYLQQRGLKDNLECLELYEACSRIILRDYYSSQSNKELPLEGLVDDVTTVREMAEDLDGVPQIDMALMESFNRAITSQSRSALLAVLEETKVRMCDHLRRVHESFRRYVLEPCSLSK